MSTDDAARRACKAFLDDAAENGVYRLFAPLCLDTFARAKYGRELGDKTRFVPSTTHVSSFSGIARRGRNTIGWRCIAVGARSSSRFTRGRSGMTRKRLWRLICGRPPMPDDLDALDRTAIFINARTSPQRPDRDVSKAQLHREADETFRTLGEQMGGDVALQALAFVPGEGDTKYLARVATAAEFGPPERRAYKRAEMIPQQLALEARIDLDDLEQETIRPLHSLRDDELSAVTKTDRSGRPMTEFYSRRGPSVWMDAFADPVRRYVSGRMKRMQGAAGHGRSASACLVIWAGRCPFLP